MKQIHSVKNPQVKQWKKLLTKKERDKQGPFMVEGFHLVEEAIKKIKYRPVKSLSRTIGLAAAYGLRFIPVTVVTDEISNEYLIQKHLKGFIAVCRQTDSEIIPDQRKNIAIMMRFKIQVT